MASLFAQQSPRSSGWLKKLVSPAVFSAVAGAYEFATSLGAADEPHVARTPGATFNPLPARLILLLSKEGGVTDKATLCAAPFLPVAREETNKTPAPELTSSWHLACTARALPQSEKQSAEVALLAITWLLDSARHLHQCHTTPTAFREALSLLFKERECIQTQPDCRLFLLADAHLERLERRV